MYVESTGTGIAVAVKMFSVHLLRTYVVFTATGIVVAAIPLLRTTS